MRWTLHCLQTRESRQTEYNNGTTGKLRKLDVGFFLALSRGRLIKRRVDGNMDGDVDGDVDGYADVR